MFAIGLTKNSIDCGFTKRTRERESERGRGGRDINAIDPAPQSAESNQLAGHMILVYSKCSIFPLHQIKIYPIYRREEAELIERRQLQIQCNRPHFLL